MLHLTIADWQHPGLDILLESAKPLANVQTRVLGLGNKDGVGHGTGFGLKLKLIKKELELLPPLQIVLFTDAFDVFLQESPSQQALIDYINANPHTVIFAGEKTNWPDADLQYPIPLQQPFPYLNSGVYAGRAADLLTLFQEPFNTKTDDQRYFTAQYLKQFDFTNKFARKTTQVRIEIDHEARFFACICKLTSKEVLISDSSVTIKSITNKTRPFVLHLNSGDTRFYWYQLISHALVGPSFSHKARDVAWRGALGPWYPYKSLILFAIAVVLLVLAFSIKSCF